MGRNAAFGRPPAPDRIRIWWSSRDPAFRSNALVALVVGTVSLGIILAALSRDTSPARPAANVLRPSLPTLVPPSTVVIEGLNAPGSSTTSTQGSTTTSTPTTVPTTVTTSTPGTSPPVATTAPPAPATTVTNPGVTFTEVTTTTVPPVATTSPVTTLPPTTARPTTTTTTTAAPQPIAVPRLVGPG